MNADGSYNFENGSGASPFNSTLILNSYADMIYIDLPVRAGFLTVQSWPTRQKPQLRTCGHYCKLSTWPFLGTSLASSVFSRVLMAATSNQLLQNICLTIIRPEWAKTSTPLRSLFYRVCLICKSRSPPMSNVRMPYEDAHQVQEQCESEMPSRSREVHINQYW